MWNTHWYSFMDTYSHTADSLQVCGSQWWWCSLCCFHPGCGWGIHWTSSGTREWDGTKKVTIFTIFLIFKIMKFHDSFVISPQSLLVYTYMYHSSPEAPPIDHTPLSDKPEVDISELIARLKEHVQCNRIRVSEHFQDFDPLRSGSISNTRFRQVRCVCYMCVCVHMAC